MLMPTAPMRSPVGRITTCGQQLVYEGGPILQNVKIYAVYWTSNVDPNVVAQIPQFYTDIASSSYLEWLSEYNTVGQTSPNGTTNQGFGPGSYGGAFTITPTTTTCTGASPCTIDDTNIKAELAAQISAGTLPAPTTGCDGQPNEIYMFEFPANVTITFTLAGGTYTSCQAFCAYHLNAMINGTYAAYGVLPDLETGPCASVCSLTPPAGMNDVTGVHSHELVEAMTDAHVSIDTSGYIYPSAWNSAGCGEIGDECNFQETPITINGHTWTVQQEWSNRQNNCVVSGTATPVCTGPNTPPGCRACTCSDNQYTGPTPADGCDGATPYCETDATNVKAGDCVQCALSSQCTAPMTYCEKSTTPSQDDICAPCGAAGQACCQPGNTCTAPNTCGGGGTPGICGCTPLTACPPPDNCGMISDGCGGMISCGTCTLPDTCGGGAGDAGAPNVCGCAPLTACPAPDNCGSIPNGCGTGMVNCGSCTAPDTCGGGPGDAGANVCGCTPKTCTAGECGMISNGCGGMLTCGSCTAPKTCGGGGTPNQCGCTPKTCMQMGAACGTVSDGCMSTLQCGSCPSGQTCLNSKCVAGITDGGGGDSSSGGGDSGSPSGDGSVGGSDGGGGGSGNGGGCGCRVAETRNRDSSELGFGAFALLGLALASRRRRS